VGSTSEWLRVLSIGAFWGLCMFLWDAVTKPESFARLLNLAGLVLSSLVFGMGFVFGWNVLHGKLVAVFGIAMLALLAVGWTARRAHRREGVDSKTL
jgi:hypothetical protein